MKNVFASALIALTLMSTVAEIAARPLGGGRSIGRQSQSVTRQQAAPAAPMQRQQAAPAPAPVAPAAVPKPASRWKGMLGGALLGLGLGAMLSHFGLGGAMASAISSILMIVLLAAAAFFIYNMFRRKSAGAGNNNGGFNPAPAGNNQAYQPAAFEQAPQQSSNATYAPAAQFGVPADFDSEAFLRHAKSSFIRMQAAWDKADTNDLREFTTPEVYAELKMQIQERGATADFTDVVSIDGQLLGIETIGNEYLASVKFTGMIKSAPNAAAEPFNEVWNMSKPVSGNGGWVLAGIQQLS